MKAEHAMQFSHDFAVLFDTSQKARVSKKRPLDSCISNKKAPPAALIAARGEQGFYSKVQSRAPC